MPEDFVIGGEAVSPGRRKQIDLKIAKLYDHTEINMPVEVIHGEAEGPVLFVSAAVHGDEINGTEVIRRLLSKKRLFKQMKGTLIAVPIVNVFGFNRNIRYLPDRRDLNRCFPGSDQGSLGSQIAKIFMDEIVLKSTHGIDIHTATMHRNNLPQIRAGLDDPVIYKLAHAFGVPVVLDTTSRDGSLRQAATDQGIPTLVFEGGEALRYDEKSIRSALRGILAVMNSIGMLQEEKISLRQRRKEVCVARASYWVRAPHSGILLVKKHLGDRVEKGEVLAYIANPFGGDRVKVAADAAGMVIGITVLPLVTNGYALFHIGVFEDLEQVEERVELYDELL